MASDKRVSDAWVETLSGIQESRGQAPDGEDWVTFKELRKMYRCGSVKMYDIINNGIKKGNIETFQGSSPNDSGRLVRRVWYRLAKV